MCYLYLLCKSLDQKYLGCIIAIGKVSLIIKKISLRVIKYKEENLVNVGESVDGRPFFYIFSYKILNINKKLCYIIIN